MHLVNRGIFLLDETSKDWKAPENKDYCKYAVHYRQCEKQKIGTRRQGGLIERDA